MRALARDFETDLAGVCSALREAGAAAARQARVAEEKETDLAGAAGVEAVLGEEGVAAEAEAQEEIRRLVEACSERRAEACVEVTPTP